MATAVDGLDKGIGYFYGGEVYQQLVAMMKPPCQRSVSEHKLLGEKQHLGKAYCFCALLIWLPGMIVLATVCYKMRC